ncbi:uncharacterized protein LOC125941941, partial [Dermacentor silvarum]|uniref:uncharacterized protein LOC125941941 n=1 Tax=Dermacentor silvarum TaxID=543639 RepID=UPI0021019DA6
MWSPTRLHFIPRFTADRSSHASTFRLWHCRHDVTKAMSLGITVTKAACHTPSKVITQVEVGTQCSLPLADKSNGCSLKAWSVSRSTQTMEVVDQSSCSSGYVMKAYHE